MGLKKMWSFFRRSFLPNWSAGRSRAEGRGFPALVRIRRPDGVPAHRVAIDGRYEPSGRQVRETRPTPQGLCIFHWRANGHDEKLSLRLEADGATAELEVEHDRLSPSEVIEVTLHQET